MGFFQKFFKGVGDTIEVIDKIQKARKSTPHPSVCEWCGKRPEGASWCQNVEIINGEQQTFGFFCSEKCRLEAKAVGKRGTPYHKGWDEHVKEFGSDLWTGKFNKK